MGAMRRHLRAVNGRGGRRDAGQVLVIFAVAITVLFAAAGLAFDVGRFYSERRFLQNAADAGALAAANALIRGESNAEAIAQAEDVLTRNFASSPSGVPPTLPPAIPVYAPGHAGDPNYLINGILISGNEVRVAVQNPVGYTFGRIVGLDENTIGGQARVSTTGDLLPIAVRHYINAPGPTSGAVSPCDGNTSDFQDLVSTADTACLGTETDASLRQAPSAGMAFDAANPNNDPSHHGPIINLVGQGAQASNSSSFRGFVCLDIRNFQSSTSNVFYNGVTSGMNANTLKEFEAAWVASGYPGPDFPPVTTPPDPNDQIGILDGNNSGIIIDAVDGRYVPGDEILAAVYSGTVMTIPDFALTVASTTTIGTTQNRNGAVTMSATKNNSFTGTVTTSAFTDWGDPANPYGTTLSPLTFTPNPATPATTITWATFNTTAAPVGIYTIWIQGHSPSPYLTDHYYPVAINIGGVTRDFSSTGSGLLIPVTTTGETGTGSFTISTPNNGSTAFSLAAAPSTVTLTLEGGPQSNGVLPVGLGATSLTPSSFTLTRGQSQSIAVSINGGSLGPGEYPLTIRATGANSEGQVVTRLIPITFDIATAGTSSNYVDIMGFAVFRITDVNSNSIDGYAISGVYADMNDPALRRGQVARLVPWN
jgi:hypothetical protein